MKIKTTQILFGTLLCLVCGTAVSPAAPIDVGPFTRFYRNTQLQGNYVSGGLMLQAVPAYLTDSTLDFPYARKVSANGSFTEKEVPFVDHMSITRYLGGFRHDWFSSNAACEAEDLAIKPGGVLVIQNGMNGTTDKVGARTSKYVEQSYEGDSLTVSLDNVPWALARQNAATGDPLEGPYGQTSPPNDWNEWHDAVKGICQSIQTDYQGRLPEQIRFKMGCEFNTLKSFHGTQEDYFKFYDYSVQAVKEVFPNAFVMPCELGSGETGGNVNMLEFMDHVANGTNYATGGTGTPINGIARSLNCFGGVPDMDPRLRMGAAKRTFQAMTNRVPGKYTRNDLTYELHQFGWINNECDSTIPDGNGNTVKVRTNEPGVRGAVWYYDIIAGLKAENLLDWSWHWGQMDTVKSGNVIQYLPTTLGLLMQVLDSFEGMEWYILDNPADNADGTFYRASLFTGANRRYLLVTSYNVTRSYAGSGNYVEVKIPKATLDLGPTPQILCRAWHEDNTVYSRVRNDLIALNKTDANPAGTLHADYFNTPYTFGPVKSMSSNATTGQQMVVNNITTYQNVAKTMLKVNQSYTGTFTSDSSTQTLRFYMRDTSIMILKL